MQVHLEQALFTRRSADARFTSNGLVFHSDAGSQAVSLALCARRAVEQIAESRARPSVDGACGLRSGRIVVMRSVEVVVFDWYNTLAAPHPDDFWTRIPELIERAGGRPDEAPLLAWEADHPLEHEQHSVSEDVYRTWQRQRFERLLAACSLSEEGVAQLSSEVERLRYTRLFDVFDDAIDTIVALREDGIAVGICSNWDWDLDRHLAHNGINALVDFVVCSAREGYRKPHPAIFEMVKQRAGSPPERILFVGDNLHDDIGGATCAGLRSVHVHRSESCEPGLHPAPSACIVDLTTLLTLVR